MTIRINVYKTQLANCYKPSWIVCENQTNGLHCIVYSKTIVGLIAFAYTNCKSNSWLSLAYSFKYYI